MLAYHLQGNNDLIIICLAEGLSTIFCVYDNAFCCAWLSCETSCGSLQIESSSEDQSQSPELGAISYKDPSPPLESRQTESDDFTTQTKKSLLRNLKMLSPEQAIPPDTDLGSSGSKDLPSDFDSELDASKDVSSVKKSRSYKRQQIKWDNVFYFIK